MTNPIDLPVSAVSARGLALHYGETVILRSIDLSLARGRTLALLGPSGCGKTTLLRLVAGLLQPTKGAVSIAGQVVADAGTGVFAPPERRNLGMVFQDYALWPHLTVGGNVSFPLEMRGIGRAERNERTMRALRRVGLEAYADRRASSSVSPSRVLSLPSRSSSSSTSRSPISTANCARTWSANWPA
jgi:iron(III) transport system ATP-binding protein